jgi:GDP/UDP-N,N'-diacetylbacillosamine 2-epimerase (hydrolysing)
MKIGVLTSSRADFGIYLPLIKKLKEDNFFKVSLIVFGTHLSKNHGYTIQEIIENGFEPNYVFEPVIFGDSPNDIAKSITATFNQFDKFWSNNYKDFDLVLCLGDRYEMFAAVASGIPFGIKYCHIHGGETTLGAIDNIYRHSITLTSYVHFTAAEEFSNRVSDIIGTNENIFTVGSLSLDGVDQFVNLTEEDFFNKWNVDLNLPSILITLHPETVAFQQVEKHSLEILNAINELSKEFQIIITMPNADTSSMIIRNMINQNLRNKKNIFIFESLGKQSYFAAMKYCSLMIGNTSSGIIEAASFNKFVINLGERQKGRLFSDNVLHTSFNCIEILDKVDYIRDNQFNYTGVNKYFKLNVANSIINILKKIEIDK